MSHRGEDTGKQDSLGAIIMMYHVVIILWKRHFQLWLELKARLSEPQTPVIPWMTMIRNTCMPDDSILPIVPRSKHLLGLAHLQVS